MKAQGAASEKVKKEIADKAEHRAHLAKANAARLKRLNPFDGLIHDADGTKEFIEGGRVEGANTSEYIGQSSENILKLKSVGPDDEVAAKEQRD